MIKTVKTAITIPNDDFAMIEWFRKKLKKSRSEIIVEALREWMNAHKKKTLDDRYAEAYQKKPEDLSEIKKLMETSLHSFGKDHW